MFVKEYNENSGAMRVLYKRDLTGYTSEEMAAWSARVLRVADQQTKLDPHLFHYVSVN